MCIFPTLEMLLEINNSAENSNSPSLHLDFIKGDMCSVSSGANKFRFTMTQLIGSICYHKCRVTNPSLIKTWKGWRTIINTPWCEGKSFEEWEEKYESSPKYIYLHGKCHEFALNYSEPTDKFCVWTCYSDELERVTLLHCFIIRENYFIDIRGVTDNKQAVYEGFEDWDISQEIIFENKQRLIDFLIRFGVMKGN